MANQLATQTQSLPQANGSTSSTGRAVPFLPIEQEAVLTADISLEMRRDNFAGDVTEAAARLHRGLQPVAYSWLKERLTMLWEHKPKAEAQREAKAAGWLGETVRFLMDYPQDILAHAIDAAATNNSYLPDVSEIRAVADPILNKRKLCAARLRDMAQPVADTPAIAEPHQCTPEQAADIIKEFGLKLRA